MFALVRTQPFSLQGPFKSGIQINRAWKLANEKSIVIFDSKYEESVWYQISCMKNHKIVIHRYFPKERPSLFQHHQILLSPNVIVWYDAAATASAAADDGGYDNRSLRILQTWRISVQKSVRIYNTSTTRVELGPCCDLTKIFPYGALTCELYGAFCDPPKENDHNISRVHSGSTFLVIWFAGQVMLSIMWCSHLMRISIALPSDYRRKILWCFPIL